MKPAVVYVLADGAAGLYSRMAVMSVYSLQRYHPDIPVWLVMDPETFGRLERLGSALIDMATPVVEKVPVQFDVTERSRYLKTRMRSIVQGDFLYIDTDTIICAPLDGIDRVDADLAAVADANSPLGLWYPDTIAKCEKAGFAGLKGKPYYNGGIRVWCAACSSGEEVYSVLMLLLAYYPPHAIALLATDCNRERVCQCREGYYPLKNMVDIPHSCWHYLMRSRSGCRFRIRSRKNCVSKSRNACYRLWRRVACWPCPMTWEKSVFRLRRHWDCHR